MAISFGLPKSKYKSPNILLQLKIPFYADGWYGKNVSDKLNLRDERYNFISEIFARLYMNKYNESLVFLILDAGNFHNPKACFGSSGYHARDLADTEFNTGKHRFKARTIYFQKGEEGFIVIYWICIDKKRVDWTRQKLLQLWYSLFNKEKVGLMVRLDMPVNFRNFNSSVKNAQDFITDISSEIPAEQAEYIFGKQR